MEISHLAQFAFGLMDVLVFIRLEGVGTPQASSHSWVNNQRGYHRKSEVVGLLPPSKDAERDARVLRWRHVVVRNCARRSKAHLYL